MKINEILCEKRKSAGISLRELARRLCIAASYLSDLEAGKRTLPFQLAAKVCDVLSIKEERLDFMFLLAKERESLPDEAVNAVLKDRTLFEKLTGGTYGSK